MQIYRVLASNVTLSWGTLVKNALKRCDRLTGTTGDLESHISKNYHLAGCSKYVPLSQKSLRDENIFWSSKIVVAHWHVNITDNL